jgi:hypothetical protein
MHEEDATILQSVQHGIQALIDLCKKKQLAANEHCHGWVRTSECLIQALAILIDIQD